MFVAGVGVAPIKGMSLPWPVFRFGELLPLFDRFMLLMKFRLP